MAIKKTSFEIQEAEIIGSGEVVPWGTSPIILFDNRQSNKMNE